MLNQLFRFKKGNRSLKVWKGFYVSKAKKSLFSLFWRYKKNYSTFGLGGIAKIKAKKIFKTTNLKSIFNSLGCKFTLSVKSNKISALLVRNLVNYRVLYFLWKTYKESYLKIKPTLVRLFFYNKKGKLFNNAVKVSYLKLN